MCLGREGLFRRKIHKTGSFIAIHMHKGYWTMNKKLPETEKRGILISCLEISCSWWPFYKSDTNQTL